MLKQAVVGVVLAGILLAHAASAADDPWTVMPAHVGPFWFNESPKSAERKCDSFEVTYFKGSKSINKALCIATDNRIRYELTFTRKGKLTLVVFSATQDGYDYCAKQVLDAIGAKGRSEDDDGYEIWGMNFVDDRDVKTGWVMCRQLPDSHVVAFGLR